MSNSAPVNVKLKNPTEILPEWEDEVESWLTLNREIKGHPNFYPLTIKAAYVVGVIHNLCKSVSILLNDENTKSVSYIPAYGVFASGVELLGRCIRGNSSTHGSTQDLKAGFKWLVSSFPENYKDDYEAVTTNSILVKTSKYLYSIDNLAALRHYAAHGQATSREITKGTYEFGCIDYEILAHMPHLIANGMEKYWSELQSSEDLCNRLAKAKIIALRKWPIFLSWSLFKADESGVHHSVGDIFSEFDWRV